MSAIRCARTSRALPAPESRFAGHSGRLKLLVVGGSQGAAVFNEVVPAAVGTLAPEARPEVWHQCGRKHLARVEAAVWRTPRRA